MRDDDEGSLVPVEEALEALQPVEVEVVRGLVEQQHVEAREQDRRQRRSCVLAAGEPGRRPVEVDDQPELRAHHARTRLEVAAAEGEEPLQRERVAILGALALGDGRRRFVQLPLRSGDAGAAGEGVEQRLAFAPPPLLRQVPRGQPLGRTRDRSGVRRLEAGEDPEQRRLADAVGADDAEPGVRADRERDLIENLLGAEVLRDACELNSHRRTS